MRARVGDVMSVDAGKGFNITNEGGRPLLTDCLPFGRKGPSCSRPYRGSPCRGYCCHGSRLMIEAKPRGPRGRFDSTNRARENRKMWISRRAVTRRCGASVEA